MVLPDFKTNQDFVIFIAKIYKFFYAVFLFKCFVTQLTNLKCN